MWSNQWNANWKEKPKYSEKTCPSATLSTTNPTWSDRGSNPGRRGGKPATHRLSYGTAMRRIRWSRYVALKEEAVNVNFKGKGPLQKLVCKWECDIKINYKEMFIDGWTRFSSIKIQSNEGHLCVWQWNFGFQEKRGTISSTRPTPVSKKKRVQSHGHFDIEVSTRELTNWFLDIMYRPDFQSGRRFGYWTLSRPAVSKETILFLSLDWQKLHIWTYITDHLRMFGWLFFNLTAFYRPYGLCSFERQGAVWNESARKRPWLIPVLIWGNHDYLSQDVI
jgi:hypothetical protein